MKETIKTIEEDLVMIESYIPPVQKFIDDVETKVCNFFDWLRWFLR